MKRIALTCGALLLGAMALSSGRAVAQNESTAAPRSIVRTVAKSAVASGVAADSQNRVDYAAANRIARTETTPTAAGASAFAAGDGQRGSLGDGGPAINAQLDLAAASPKNPSAGSGIAIGPSGNLFIADTQNDTVRRVDAQTGVITSVLGKWASGAQPEGFARPIGVATDASGDLFVTASNSIYRVDAETGAPAPIATVAGATAIAVTPDGQRLYILSAATPQIFEITKPGAASSSSTSAASLSVFAAASGANSSRTSVQLTGAPSGIGVDSRGDVFVAESANIIERVDAVTHAVTRVAGTGVAGRAGDGGAALAAQFNAPGALALDSDGNLFVADVGNGIVREVTNVTFAQTGIVTLTPNTFNFGDQLIGGTSAAEAFTLTNNSSVTVSGIAVSFAGGATPADFTQTTSCAGELATSSSCTINVFFTPQASGLRSASLYVTDSDPSSPQTAALSGTGDDFELAIPPSAPTQVTVVDGQTGTFQVQGQPDNVFSGTIALNCPYNLPKNTTCTITTNPATTPPTLTLTAGSAPQVFSIAFQTTYRQKTTGPGETLLTPVGGSKPQFPAPLARPALAITLGALLAFALVISAKDAPRRWLLKAAVPAFFVAILLVVAPGCTSSYPTTSTKTTIYEGTPAGTYNMAVTATAQGATRAVNITLVVQ